MSTTFAPLDIRFPDNFDGDDNLFLMHDALRFSLGADYQPGDTSILLDGSPEDYVRLPEEGIITLTDQCSPMEVRAISFRYRKDATLDMTLDVELLPDFTDVPKTKKVATATANVMALHHTQVKDALIAIERYIGVQGRIDSQPFSKNATLEGRINYLRRIVLSPKAYFTGTPTIGLAPLTVTFTDRSFRLGTDGTAGDVTFIWDFGDGVENTITILAKDMSKKTPLQVQHTYTVPGKYDVSLTVRNDFNTDTIRIPDMISVRTQAPKPAHILFPPIGGVQIGSPGDEAPIRTPMNTLVTLNIPQREDPTRLNYSYAGEMLINHTTPMDPVQTYTWGLSDDLTHSTGPSTKASYSVGGLYDAKVRTDTLVGCYRITTVPNAIDVVERDNLWFFLYGPNSTTLVNSYEFSPLAETFKLAGPSTLTVARDDSFLTGQPREIQQKREFARNAGFAPSSTTASGDRGDSLLFYASGRDDQASPATEEITFTSFNGFAQTFAAVPSFARPWNWASLVSNSTAYFLFGTTGTTPSPGTSPTNPQVDAYGLASFTTTSTQWTSSNFSNGGDELLTNAGFTDTAQDFAHFSVYRSTWKDSTGFLMRNAGVGAFFRLQNFYATAGTVASPVQGMAKLLDMPGSPRPEGQLVTLSSGVYFFGNSGQIAAYNPSSMVWETGGPGANSASFRSLQDQTVSGYDLLSQPLLAASDKDKRAYLSFDYSPNSFIKFSATDTSFFSLPSRPLGTQFALGMY